MRCLVCGKIGNVSYYDRDDPVLECQHKQCADPMDLIIEQTVFETCRQIEARAYETGKSEHDTCEQMIEEELESMPHNDKVRILHTLHANKVKTPATERVSGRLSKVSQRYVNGRCHDT